MPVPLYCNARAGLLHLPHIIGQKVFKIFELSTLVFLRRHIGDERTVKKMLNENYVYLSYQRLMKTAILKEENNIRNLNVPGPE